VFTLRVTNAIAAPPVVCFDLARSVGRRHRRNGKGVITDIRRWSKKTPVGLEAAEVGAQQRPMLKDEYQ